MNWSHRDEGQKGFTLIELMTAVAVISILLAIAIPSYMNYLAKAKLTAALQEITALKWPVEDAINSNITAPSLAGIGVTQTSTSNCLLSLASDSQGGSQVLSCTLVNPPYPISGGVLTLNRSNAGVWTCAGNANIDSAYLPPSCLPAG